MGPSRPRTVAVILLLAALGAWWVLATGGTRPVDLLTVAVLGALAALPQVRGVVGSALDRLRHPSPPTRLRITLGVWLAALVYLVATAFWQGRDLFPKVHDEHSYLIQTRMLAAGRLWMPRHDLADFFESFHVLTDPVYASIYFPGTALLNAPAVWAGQPTWAEPALAAALVVALTYWCVAELVDGAWGLVAALLVLGVSLLRTHSTLVMSQVPAALLGMLTVWAYLRWRRARRPGWAMLVGAFAGWAAVTRPVDALAFAAPVGAAMLLDLRAAGATRLGLRALAAAFGFVVAGAAPFLLLQAVFNQGVTGSLFKTPYVLYLERYQPGSRFASGRGPTTALATTLPQKLEYYREFLASNDGRHPGQRVRTTGAAAVAAPLLLALVPMGLPGMLRRRRWVLGAAAPLFFGLYLLNPYYLPHYTVPMVPALAMWVAAAGRGLEEATSSDGLRRFVTAWLAPATVVLCAGRLPELNSAVRDEWIDLPTVRMAHDTLPQAVQRPAVVLFKFRPGNSPHDEPVYNDDVAWPDDASIVRAHDLGERQREVIEYYAARQPDRQLYRYDRGDGMLTRLGTAAELARQTAK